jgi:hypothetical protein
VSAFPFYIQIEFLCKIGGAHVATSLSMSELEYGTGWIVLVPDSLDDEETFLNNLVDYKVITRDLIDESKRTKKVHFVYFSWLIDTILADIIAPFDNYVVDYFKKN